MGFIYIKKKKSKSKLYFAQLIVMVKMLTKTFVRFVTDTKWPHIFEVIMQRSVRKKKYIFFFSETLLE